MVARVCVGSMDIERAYLPGRRWGAFEGWRWSLARVVRAGSGAPLGLGRMGTVAIWRIVAA